MTATVPRDFSKLQQSSAGSFGPKPQWTKPSAAPVAISAGIPASRFAEELGRRLVQNIVMVGFFTAVTGLMPKDAAAKAVKDSVPPATIDLNMRAFERGYQHGVEVMAAKGGVPA